MDAAAYNWVSFWLALRKSAGIVDLFNSDKYLQKEEEKKRVHFLGRNANGIGSFVNVHISSCAWLPQNCAICASAFLSKKNLNNNNLAGMVLIEDCKLTLFSISSSVRTAAKI